MTLTTCPKCSARMAVVYTRPTKDGTVKRLRRCPKCGHRRPTIER